MSTDYGATLEFAASNLMFYEVTISQCGPYCSRSNLISQQSTWFGELRGEHRLNTIILRKLKSKKKISHPTLLRSPKLGLSNMS